MPENRGMGWGTYLAIVVAAVANIFMFIPGGIWERAVKETSMFIKALAIPLEFWPGLMLFMLIWSPIMYIFGYYVCYVEYGEEEGIEPPAFLGKSYRGQKYQGNDGELREEEKKEDSEEKAAKKQEMVWRNFQADVDNPVKMVLVVREDLKMSPGKVATQVGHCAVGMYRRLWQKNAGLIQSWERVKSIKIITKVPGEPELLHVQKRAKELGLPSYIVRDAGFKIVDISKVENGNRTVLGFLGPASVLAEAMQGLVAYE